MADSCLNVQIELPMIEENVHFFYIFQMIIMNLNFFQNFFFFINQTKQKKNHSSLQLYMAIGLLIWAYILINFFHVHDQTFIALTDKTRH